MDAKLLTPHRILWAIYLCWISTLWPCSAFGIAAAAPEVRIAQTPEWVAEVTVDPSQKADVLPPSGAYYLLVDKQINALSDQVIFAHFSIQLSNEEAVEENSVFSVEFDPSYQELQIHSIKVWRNGKVIDKLNPDKIELLRRETQLERLIYDGRWTASLILDDIRKGDILDYSYSIHGENPALDGHYSSKFRTQWATPVLRQHFRLLWPHERTLHVLPVNTDHPIERIDHDTHSTYSLDIGYSPSLRVDSDTPGWYWPWARFNFSDLGSWREVVDWALPKYRLDSTLDPKIATVVADISNRHKDKKNQAGAALEFVQNEVRYQGIEIGIGGFQPHPAAETFVRRYGDCKDKTVLLLTLLDALGIEAYAALVNIYAGKRLDVDGPRVNAFDHVIAHVTIDGKHYWLDPTMNNQYGGIDIIYQPNYGLALVLSESSSGLVPMDKNQVGHTRQFWEEFDLSAGVDKSASYRISSVYSGAEAETFRGDLSSIGLKQLEKNYLDYYSGYYATIESAAALLIKDDKDSGKIMLEERYSIPKFWEDNKESSRHQGEFHSNAIYGYLREPETRRRTSPLRLQHPIEIEQEITVLLNGDWELQNEDNHIASPFFDYKKRVRFNQELNKLVLYYQYKSLADHVPVEDMGSYLAYINQAMDDLDYHIYSSYSASAQETTAGTILGGELTKNQILLIFFSIAFLLMIYVYTEYRLNQRHAPDSSGISYYPVSSLKFFLLSLISMGLYYVFWFYKNWSYVKQREQSTIIPWGRALFCLFWYYPLYRSINQDLDYSKTSLKPDKDGIFIFLAILFLLSNWVSGSESIYGTVAILVSVLAVLPLVERINTFTPTDDPVFKFNSRWRPRHLAVGLFFCSILGVALAVQTSLIPGNGVIEGAKLWQHDREFLHRIGVVEPGEEVELYYSAGFLTNQTDGNGFTKRRVFSYWLNETTQRIEIQAAPYKEIENIEYTNGDKDEDTVAKVTRKDGSYFLLFISKENGKDWAFKRRLDKLWREQKF